MLALYISLLDTEEQISKFEHIYTKYRGLMFYTAKGVLQDSYLAEDAVHETFLDIIRIIDSIRANNEKELSQFLRVLTHHKAVDMVRKCTRQKKSDTEIEDSHFLPDETMNKLFTGADGETLYTDDGYQYKLSTMPWCQDGTCKR